MHIVVPDRLWSDVTGEAAVERWLVGPLGFVRRGHPVVRLRIGNAIHELRAPCSGYVCQSMANAAPLRRGDVLGEIGACRLPDAIAPRPQRPGPRRPGLRRLHGPVA